MESLATVILAAGEGKRMKSDLVKILHPVCGRPMVTYVIKAARAVGSDRIILVVGHQWERVVDALQQERVEFVVQEERLGTAHALLQTKQALVDFRGELLVLCGDTPLLSGATVSQLLERHRASGATASVLTAILENPFGYGRILRDPENMLDTIVEEKDATDEQRAFKEVNSGAYCFRAPLVFDILDKIGQDNRQGEFYLTDAIAVLRDQGLPVAAVVAQDAQEALGVNSREQLLEAERTMACRLSAKIEKKG
jgi:bifunctional UDP-N-acetylglucosamine pyrophosphorylase/glucosamine-1-phosphate N-acetyltransferase